MRSAAPSDAPVTARPAARVMLLPRGRGPCGNAEEPPAGRTCFHVSRSGWRLILSLLVLLFPWPARSEEGDLEYAVKATYLCKLPAFVTWPLTMPRTDDFVLCIVGRGPYGSLLDNAAAGQTAQQRPIVIRRYETVAGNPGCQLMFVAGSNAQSVASVLAAVRGTPVLTVTDDQTDPVATGIVNFVLVDGHVRFEIDQRSAADNGLVISSKLLSLATRVRDRLVQ